MAVDWSAVSEAIRRGQTGHARESLQLLTSFESACECDGDRVAVSLAQSMCYAHLGSIPQAFAYVETAKQLAGERRDYLLQVELAEAAIRMLNSEYRTACDLYERIARSYGDLLAADCDSAQEFDERFGYALVNVERYDEAVRILQRLLRSNRLQDDQRVRLYLGVALAASGHPRNAYLELELAVKGPDAKLAKDALERLEILGEIQ